MCGIAGVYFKKKIDSEKKEKFRQLVQEKQFNRGPDDFNELSIEKNLYFFHNRLSIIDIEHAQQPMEDQDGVLAFNGEIYNYESLRYPDTEYQYQSDTEVLLKGFAKERETFLHKTNSMFGFAYYDKAIKTIQLCRDRIGIKQLYYIDNDEIFAFASTITPLTIFSQKELNSDHLWGYYLNRAFKAPHTIFKDIKELTSGTVLTFDTQKSEVVSLDTWWSRDELTTKLSNENEVLEQLDGLLHQSVKDRLVADVPVGSFLSGGVDSSLVTAIASQYNPKLEAFTVAMKDKRYDESPYAQAITKKYNLKYHQVVLTGEEFLDEIDNWVTLQDDVVANPSSLMLHKLAALARDNGYKVMLAGEGADELFAGYGSYNRFLKSKQLYKYLKLAKPFASPISKLFKGDSRKEFFVYNMLNDPRYYGVATIFEPHLIQKLLDHEVERSSISNLKQALDNDIKDRVPNDLLTSNGDRATMGASIEARVPFLAHQIVNFSATIDESLFTKNGEMKYLLKKLASQYIPHDNIYRKKVGFELPLKDWFRNELKDTLHQLIESSVQKEHINIDVIRSLFKSHLDGKIDASGKLWAFVALELSYRKLKDIGNS